MPLNEHNLKKLDILLLLLLPILAAIISLIYRTNTLVSILLFYLPLSLYLSLRTKKAVIKAAVFSFFVSLGFGLIFDYSIYLDNSWFVTTIFPFRIYNYIAIEEIIWAFFFTYIVVIFFEHFIDKAKHKVLEGKAKYVLALLLIIYISFIFILMTKAELLYIPYYYFWLGFLFMFLPVVIFLSRYRKMLISFSITATYFIAHSLVYELTAIQLNQWFFHSENYIYWLSFGKLGLPLEEFLFFIVFGAMAVLTYFEFFDVEKI